LDDKIYDFLKEYDKNKDKKISVSELEIKRFTRDLRKNWGKKINAKGVKENEIAIWLSNVKINLDMIEKNNSEVNFMIFKVAPATGWDCPRAEILVMFREIDSPIFHTQIIGRIKRMPEGYHYEKEELNKAYIFTNYNKNHIFMG